MKSATRDAILVALFAAAVLTIPMLAGRQRALQGALQEDAYYYARIARNVASGSGITFDGLHATSGFHPLWLGILIPIFVACPGVFPPLFAATAAQIALVAVAAGLTTATLSRIVDRWAALAGGAALVAIPRTGATLIGGLEGALTLAAIVTAWCLFVDVTSRPNPRPSAWIVPGIAFALAGLARLEAFVFLPVALVAGYASMPRPAVSAAAFLAPGALGAVFVVAWSRALTATWLPISATVKAATRLESSHGRWLPILFGIALVGLSLAATVAMLRRGGPRPVTRALAVPVLGATLWISADLLSVGTLEPWNRVPALLLGALAVAWTGSRWRGKTVVAIVAAIGLSRASIAIARGPMRATSYAPYRWAAGLWLRDHVDAGARIGSWNAGTIGYVSERHVVNLDGLVNDRRYYDDVIHGKDLPGYLEREGIAWLADQSCGVEPSLAPYLARTGSQALARRFEPVASFYDRASTDGCPGVVIWRLTGD